MNRRGPARVGRVARSGPRRWGAPTPLVYFFWWLGKATRSSVGASRTGGRSAARSWRRHCEWPPDAGRLAARRGAPQTAPRGRGASACRRPWWRLARQTHAGRARRGARTRAGWRTAAVPAGVGRMAVARSSFLVTNVATGGPAQPSPAAPPSRHTGRGCLGAPVMGTGRNVLRAGTRWAGTPRAGRRTFIGRVMRPRSRSLTHTHTKNGKREGKHAPRPPTNVDDERILVQHRASTG